MNHHLFAAAARFQESGALAQAAPIYRQLLRDNHNNSELWCRLADVCVGLGNRPEAEACYRSALHLQPSHAGIHNNLGLVLTEQRRLDDAIASFNEAIRIQPDYPEAHNHLGIALTEKGKLDEAVASYRQAIRLRPNFAGAYQNLAQALIKQGKPAEALASCQKALRLEPDSPHAYLHQGNLLRSLSRRDEAAAAYREGLRRAPSNPDLHNELGMLLMDDGKFAEAEPCFREALRLRPDFVPVYNNLGIVLLEQGRWDEGMISYHQALQLNPNFAEALTNMGRALAIRGQLDESLDCFERAVRMAPNHPGALNNLANACRDQGRLEESVEYYRRAVAARPDDAAVHSNYLFALAYLPGIDPAEVFQKHQEYAQQHTPPGLQIADGRSQKGPSNLPSKKRLRLGYVSPDLRDHVVAFFLEPILANHDHQQFEIFCYADVSRPDLVTRRLEGYADHWRWVARANHDQAAEIIRRDQIDVLVDLAGHTGGNRLPTFARRPAPVQVTYLGYMGTTGLPSIDFRVTDPYADPPGMTEAYHSEELIRLPETGLCYRPPESPEVGPLPALSSGALTFGSFNNITKVSAEVVALWARVMRELPGSRLLVKTGAGTLADERLQKAFAANGVPAERITFLGKTTSREDYFRLHNQVDLCLGPFPYNGITTTCDALWMGTPVLTLAGRTSVSRQALSLLTNVGLPEMIAETPDDYVAIARRLSRDLGLLARWRAELRERMSNSPLTDEARFTRHLEDAYRTMWQRRVKA